MSRLFVYGILTLIMVLSFSACNDDKKAEESGPAEESYDVLPSYEQYFEENFESYVTGRYGDEVVEFSADSVTGKVRFVFKQGEEYEITDTPENFLAKCPLDFFLLNNGLHYLEVKVEKEGFLYTLNLTKSDYQKYYKVWFLDLNDGNVYNDFIKKYHSEAEIKKFIEKFIKKVPLEA